MKDLDMSTLTPEDLHKWMNKLREPVYSVGPVSIALPETDKGWNSYNTVLEYNFSDDTRRTLLTSTDLDEMIPLFKLIRKLDPLVFSAIKQYHAMEESGVYHMVILGFDRGLQLPYVQGILKSLALEPTSNPS